MISSSSLQPIGMDAIHNFNTATDKIDLMGFAGIASFGELAIACRQQR